MELENGPAANTYVTQFKLDRRSTFDGELVPQVEKIVHELPETERIALILRKYERLEYEEIAANLKITEKAAQQIVYQAYRRLREQLADQLKYERRLIATAQSRVA